LRSSSRAAVLARAAASMKSGGGVLLVSLLQLLVGLVLLGVYEGYKARADA
jgi:hypothetical protein